MSRVWDILQEALGTKLRLSFSYHQQMDGQTERTIQSLEDLSRACVLEQGVIGTVTCHWSSAPITTVSIQVLEWNLLKLCMIEGVWHLYVGMSKVQVLFLDRRLFMKLLKSLRWFSRRWRCHREDRRVVMIRKGRNLSSKREIMWSWGSLRWLILVGRWSLKSSRLIFIGLYQILQRVGEVTYNVSLPPSLSNLHDFFHVSQLLKYIPDPSMWSNWMICKWDKTWLLRHRHCGLRIEKLST